LHSGLAAAFFPRHRLAVPVAVDHMLVQRVGRIEPKAQSAISTDATAQYAFAIALYGLRIITSAFGME